MSSPMKVYTVRMHEELAVLIDEVAKEAGMDSSGFIRAACLSKVKRMQQLKKLNERRKLQREWKKCKNEEEVQKVINEMTRECDVMAGELYSSEDEMREMSKSIAEDCL
jgi:hypothetical protein